MVAKAKKMDTKTAKGTAKAVSKRAVAKTVAKKLLPVAGAYSAVQAFRAGDKAGVVRGVADMSLIGMGAMAVADSFPKAQPLNPKNKKLPKHR